MNILLSHVVRFSLFVIIINLTVFLIAGISLISNRNQYIQKTEISTKNLSHILEINLSGIIDKIDFFMFSFSNEIERQVSTGKLDEKIINDYIIHQHSKLSILESIAFADMNGNVKYGIGFNKTSNINISDREYFRDLRESRGKGLVISKPVIGKSSGKWLLIFARRVNAPDTSFAGIVFSTIPLEYFYELFSSLDIGEHGAISLRDNDLRIVVRYPESGEIGSSAGNRQISKEAIESMKTNPNEGTFFAVTVLDKIVRTVSYRKLQNYPLYITVGQASSDYLAPWWKTVVISVFLLLNILFLTVLFSRWIYRKNSDIEKEVKERTRELKDARDIAEKANKAKSLFLSNMSHEIRTPLNAILGFAQLLEHDVTMNNQSKNHVSTIKKSGQHLIDIINSILEMSQIEAGKIEVNNEPVDVVSLLRDVFTMFQQKAIEKGINFKMECVPWIPSRVLTDAAKLRQIIINLISNALKFTKHGSIELIAFESGDERVAIEVCDTGIGISQKEGKLLFQPFERTSNGIKTAGGTGLGLAISREYAHKINGQLTFESHEGKGSCFRLEFEAKKLNSLIASTQMGRNLSRLSKNQGDIRVLVVDDLEINRILLRGILEPLGFTVDEASNGEEAIVKIRENKPRIVLMDLVMPEMDGVETTRYLRKEWDYDSLVIIGISASAFKEERKRFINSGLNAFIPKPFQEEVLLQLIEFHGRVIFEYASPDEMKVLPLTKEKRPCLEKMPEDWKNKFSEALSLGSVSRIRALGDEAAKYDNSLCLFITEHINSYDIISLKELL